MNIFIYDTETTGLGKRDEVIQIAGIVTDINLTAKAVVNQYCFTNARIDPGAEQVHGINSKLLYKLSKGRYFEDVVETIPFLRDPKNIIFIAYNDSYDRRMINQTLTLQGLDPIYFGEQIRSINVNKKGTFNMCAMKTFQQLFGLRRALSLNKMVENYTEFSESQLKRLYKKFLEGAEGVNTESTNYHDALFDSFCVWVLLSKHKELIYKWV